MSDYSSFIAESENLRITINNASFDYKLSPEAFKESLDTALENEQEIIVRFTVVGKNETEHVKIKLNSVPREPTAILDKMFLKLHELFLSKVMRINVDFKSKMHFVELENTPVEHKRPSRSTRKVINHFLRYCNLEGKVIGLEYIF